MHDTVVGSLPLRCLNKVDCPAVLGYVGLFLGGTERLVEGSSRVGGRDRVHRRFARTIGDISSGIFPKNTRRD